MVRNHNPRDGCGHDRTHESHYRFGWSCQLIFWLYIFHVNTMSLRSVVIPHKIAIRGVDQFFFFFFFHWSTKKSLNINFSSRSDYKLRLNTESKQRLQHKLAKLVNFNSVKPFHLLCIDFMHQNYLRHIFIVKRSKELRLIGDHFKRQQSLEWAFALLRDLH